MIDDPVDEFLFDNRRGFCEHYASSFVFLMRAAGIPARVVVGYQGGEQNPRADHWVIRQSDAHAWVELDGEPVIDGENNRQAYASIHQVGDSAAKAPRDCSS